MQKIFFITAALLGGLAVALGTYGAHGGAETIAHNDAVITFGKAMRYHTQHTLIMFAVVWALSEWKEQTKLLNIAGWLFLAGIFLFSGSLYFISFTGIYAGLITPFGGVAFVGGWLTLAYAGYKAKIK